MKDPLFELFLSELHAVIGPYQVVIRPILAGDADDVGEFVWILGVPLARLAEVREVASQVVWNVYGATHVPFHVGVVPPEDAEVHFADEYKRTA
jgi:hypothetical protein